MRNELPPIEPGDHVEVIELKGEAKDRLNRNAHDLVEWLKQRCPKPSEACVLLDLVRGAIANNIGLKHTAILDGPEAQA